MAPNCGGKIRPQRGFRVAALSVIGSTRKGLVNWIEVVVQLIRRASVVDQKSRKGLQAVDRLRDRRIQRTMPRIHQ